MRFFITGIGGFAGAHLAEHLLAAGHEPPPDPALAVLVSLLEAWQAIAAAGATAAGVRPPSPVIAPGEMVAIFGSGLGPDEPVLASPSGGAYPTILGVAPATTSTSSPRRMSGSLEARAASLLPGLLLARVDGKSPVEYLTEDAQRRIVRRVASTLLRVPVARLDGVRAAWRRVRRRNGHAPSSPLSIISSGGSSTNTLA